MKNLFILLLALASPAFAQTDGTIVRYRDFFGGNPSSAVPTNLQATSAPYNYFVETTGSDTNLCRSTTTTCVAPACSPCRTIQGAFNKIPKIIRHQTQVLVGAGSFTGANISGFSFENTLVPPSPSGVLALKGTLVNFVVAGGATGTATAATEANAAGTAPAAFGTLTDGTKAWAVDSLRGRILEITGGPGVGQKRMIASNTATVITINGGWNALAAQPAQTLPTAASTYAIRDWATNVNVGLPTVQAYENFNAAQSGSLSGTLELLQVNAGQASTSISTASIVVDQLKFSGGATRALKATGDGQISLLRSRFEMTGGGQEVLFQTTTDGSIFYCSAALPAAAGSRWLGWGFATAPLNISYNVIDDGQFGVDTPYSGFATLQANSFRRQTVAAITLDTPQQVGILVNDIDCATLGGTGVVSSAVAGFIVPASKGLVFTGGNNITSCATAISIFGNISLYPFFSFAAPITGAGNTTAVNMSAGAKYQLKATDTLTGTTEYLVDGKPFTKVQIESFAPKSVFSRGTFIFEL